MRKKSGDGLLREVFVGSLQPQKVFSKSDDVLGTFPQGRYAKLELA
jgi:hypothetical protein